MNIGIFLSHNDRHSKPKYDQDFSQVDPFSDLDELQWQFEESDYAVHCEVQDQPQQLIERERRVNRDADALVCVYENDECEDCRKDHAHWFVLKIDLPA